MREIGGPAQREALQTWTVVTTLVSVVGTTVVLILSTLFPLTRPDVADLYRMSTDAVAGVRPRTPFSSL